MGRQNAGTATRVSPVVTRRCGSACRFERRHHDQGRTIPRTCTREVLDLLARPGRHTRTLVHPAQLSLESDVDHAEAVPLGIGEDDVVRVRRSLVPVNLGSTER